MIYSCEFHIMTSRLGVHISPNNFEGFSLLFPRAYHSRPDFGPGYGQDFSTRGRAWLEFFWLWADFGQAKNDFLIYFLARKITGFGHKYPARPGPARPDQWAIFFFATAWPGSWLALLFPPPIKYFGFGVGPCTKANNKNF